MTENPENVETLLSKKIAKLGKGVDPTRSIANYNLIGEGKHQDKLPLKPSEIMNSLRTVLGNKNPFINVRGQFVYISHDRIIPVRSTANLMATLARAGVQCLFCERGEGMVTKADFLSYFQDESPCFDDITELPHYPPKKNVRYTKQWQGEENGYLDKLLEFFKPADETSRALLKAAFLTPFWGGPGGSRPAFVITARDDDQRGGRGVGKTFLANTVGEIAGGIMQFSSRIADMDGALKRILTSNGERVILFDNIKGKTSGEHLESIITSKTLTGHKMYVGNQSMENLFTVFLTLNGPEFSQDMAERSVRIILDRPDYDIQWDLRYQEFISEHRDDIVNDILGILKRPAGEVKKGLRFNLWLSGVLDKVSGDDDIVTEIKRRQVELDDDALLGEAVRECVMENIANLTREGHKGYIACDPSTEAYAIKRSTLSQWLANEFGWSKRYPLKVLPILDIPELHIKAPAKYNGIYYVWWIPTEGTETVRRIDDRLVSISTPSFPENLI